MSGSAVQVTNLAVDLADPLCECINGITGFFEEARIGANEGLTNLGASIGNAITACCSEYVQAKYVTPQTATFTSQVLDADGNPVTLTSTVTGPGNNGLQGALGYQAWQNQTGAYAAQQQAWQDQWQAYIEDLQDYRNIQTAIYTAQIVAELLILREMLELRKCFLETAKEALGDQRTLQAKLSTVACDALDDANAHLDEISPKASDELTKACASMDGLATRQELLFTLWNESGEGDGLGYANSQSAHVENISTHLAQLCFLGRDSANDLRAQCQELDDVWRTGGGWMMLEDKLTAQGEGTFQGQLCNSADMAGEITEYMSQCGMALADCFATDAGTGSYAELIKPTMDNLIMGINAGGDILTQLNDSIEQAQQCVTDYKARYEAAYGNAEDVLSPQILTAAGNLFADPAVLTDCFDFLTECATTYKDGFEAYHVTGELPLAEAIFGQAQCIAEQENHKLAIDFISKYKDDCLAIYTSVYENGETALQQAVMALATDMTACVSLSHEWLSNHSDEMDACWQSGYAGEKPWASALLAQAETLVTKHAEIIGWLCDCAIELKAQYASTYQPGENMLALGTYMAANSLTDDFVINDQWFDDKAQAELACAEQYRAKEKLAMCEIMDEGIALADCVSLTHDWLCTQADKTYQHWCDTWIPKEQSFVCKIFDEAEELTDDSLECLKDWCDYIDDQIEEWNVCYNEAECANLPKLIEAVTPACVKNAELFNETCDRSDKQYTGWCDNWAQCDIDDLQRHCDITNKVLPLEEICDDNTCQQAIGETLKDCYLQLGLTCEKDYVQELCDIPKYEARYCEVEDRAIGHVREQYAETEEKLRKTSGKFCSGSMIHALSQLDIERTRTESASIQAADRWEWWREMQECDRRHRYKLDMISVIERWPTNAMQALQLSTQGNDLILQRIHERILRGYQWLSHSEQNAAQTYQAMGTAMQLGISATETGHFWPNWWTQNKDRYISHTSTRMQQGIDMIRVGQGNNQQAFNSKTQAMQGALGAMDRTLSSINQGHRLLELANQDKNSAQNVVNQAVANGQNTVQLGHAQLQRAIDTRVQSAARTEAVTDDAMQTSNMGHFYHQQSSADRQAALQGALSAIDDGSQAVQQGLDHKRRALEAANLEGSQANAALQTGLATVDRGHNLGRMAVDAKQVAINELMSAWQQFTNHLEHARGLLTTAQSFQQLSDAALRDQFGKGMDAAQYQLATYNAAQRKVEASLQGAQSATDDLLQMYQLSLSRLNQQTSLKGNMAQWVPQTTQAFGSLMNVGNDILKSSNNMMAGEAEMRKRCAQYLCDTVLRSGLQFSQQATGAASSIFGLSYQAAQNATTGIQDSVGGILAGLTGINQPPVFNPVGFGGSPVGPGGAGGFGGFSGSGGLPGLSVTGPGNSFGLPASF